MKKPLKKKEGKKCRHPMSKRVAHWKGFCLVEEYCDVCKKILSKNFEEEIIGLTIVTRG